MKQANTTQPTLSIDVLRKLAFMQHESEDYFILTDAKGSKVYEGTEKDARIQFDSEMEDNEDGIVDFYEWCNDNLTEVDEFSNDDYMVLTDEEADEKVKEYIEDSLWAFNAEFIIGECGLDYSGADSLRKMQSDACEGANDFIRSLIDKCTDIDSFVEAAVSADGRGHFLSGYDGNENEETITGVTNEDTDEDKTTFYIYRTN